MKYMKLLLLLVVSLPGLITVAAQPTNRGSWKTLASMPSSRQEVSTAVLDGKIFVIAGFQSSGASTNTIEVYDPQTNTWSGAAALPIATNHNAAAVAGGRLYAFGGTSARTFVYNAQMNTWSDVVPMNFQHGNTPAVGVIDGKIYVAGGTGPGMAQNEVEVYDPVTNTWTQLASMNIPRNHTGGGVIDGKFYVAGGRGSDNSTNALEVYDPATNKWTQLPNMPTGRSGVGVAAVNGELYVFGGEIPRMFSEVEVYNPKTNKWESLQPMPTPRHGIFAAVIGNVIYIPAGATVQGLGAVNTNEAYIVNTATTVSAADFGSRISARAIVAGFGEGLATTTLSADSQPLPFILGGTTVVITDVTGASRTSPLFFISPQQVNYQVPAGTANGPAFVLITAGDGRISTGTIIIQTTSPALFTLSQDGQGAAAALDAFTFADTPFNATRANGQPNILAFFGSGLGEDATDVDTDVSSSVQATIDGSPAVVLYAGRAPGFTGLNQFNILLLQNISSGDHMVRISRNGVLSNIVIITIK